MISSHRITNYKGLEVKLLKLRNPWGKLEWNGDWGDSEEINWTPSLKNELGWSDEDDGIFFMAYDDYYNLF